MATSAQPTSLTNILAQSPTAFDLKGHNVHIHYKPSVGFGKARLEYRDANHDRSFTGAEIRVLESEIGQLLTVTLDLIVDVGSVTATLLLPPITLSTPTTLFHTAVIIATHHTSIGGPGLLTGPHTTYYVVNVEGTAEHLGL